MPESLAFRLAVYLCLAAEVALFVVWFLACLPIWLVVFPVCHAAQIIAETLRDGRRFLAGDYDLSNPKESSEV